MNRILQRTGASFAAVLAAAVSLHASASTGLPPERSAGIASYISGGVGDGEARRFESAFKRYPLVIELLEHAGARDEYTADARVRIADRRGRTVLDERADGPFMLVHLPPGEYRISAELKGHALPAREVHVTDGGHVRTAFVWAPNAG